MIGEKIANLPNGVRADRYRLGDSYSRKEVAEELGVTPQDISMAHTICEWAVREFEVV
jgi:hypothetical protein